MIFVWSGVSRRGRRCKTRSRLCGATSRIVGIGGVGLWGRGSSLDQARDPKQLTTCQRRLTSRRIPAYESRFLTTPSYPSLRSRFRLHERVELAGGRDRKSTRLNSSHLGI